MADPRSTISHAHCTRDLKHKGYCKKKKQQQKTKQNKTNKKTNKQTEESELTENQRRQNSELNKTGSSLVPVYRRGHLHILQYPRAIADACMHACKHTHMYSDLTRTTQADKSKAKGTANTQSHICNQVAPLNNQPKQLLAVSCYFVSCYFDLEGRSRSLKTAPTVLSNSKYNHVKFQRNETSKQKSTFQIFFYEITEIILSSIINIPLPATFFFHTICKVEVTSQYYTTLTIKWY